MLNKNETSNTLTTLTLVFYNMLKPVYCELLELLAYLQMQINILTKVKLSRLQFFLHLTVSSVLKSFVKSAVITDRHPNPLFSVCIISPNAERKTMQTNCVRKTGAVFFGGREIIRGNLTRAKSTRSIIEACCIIKTKTRSIIFNNAACFRFNNAACRFSTCKITPDNFLATKNDRTRFSHTVSLRYFSLTILQRYLGPNSTSFD